MNKTDLAAYRDELMELRQIRARIDALQTQLYALRSPALTGMPHAQTVESGSAQERAADELSEKLNSLIADYMRRENELVARCRAIEAAISNLPARFRVIMRARYIDGESWHDVADGVPFSYERVMQLHRRALTLLENITYNYS